MKRSTDLFPSVRALSTILLLLLCSWTLHAATIVWTNTAGGDWQAAENWEPNQVPASGDAVLITNAGSYTILLQSGNANIDSLVLGGNGGAQLLSVINSGLSCPGGLRVEHGVSLGVVDSWFQASQLDLAGTMSWSGGTLSGALTIATNGVLNITGNSEKILDSASAITNYGLIQWSGLGMISGNDWNTYAAHSAIFNLTGALFDIQNDSTVRLSPWVYNYGATVVFQNSGTVRKSAGSGTTSFENVSLQNFGAVDIQQGTLAFNGGSGAQLVSSGLFQVSSGAAVQLNGGSCSFLPGHSATGQGFFGLGLGGFVTLDGAISGRFDWSQGVLSGHLTINSNAVLNITGDSEKTLDSASAITNYGLIQWSGQGMISGNDWNTYAAHPAIFNLAGALFDIQNDSTLRLSPWVYNFGATVVFQNAGTLRKTAGSGITSFENVSLQNSGTVDVQRGTLALNGGSGAQLVSSGLFQVTSGAAVQLNGGSCSFLPGHSATGQGFFGLGLGGFVTLDGQISGRFDWSHGVLSGHLTINTDGVLNITGDSEKTLDSASAITNFGLIQWSGQGMISGNDWNTYAAHPAILNLAGAFIDIQNDSTLRLSPWVFNFGATVVFQNAGTLRKTAGSGITSFENVSFQNSGTVDVQRGTLAFNGGSGAQLVSSGLFQVTSGAAVQLNGGSCFFLAGHTASGQGFFGLGLGGFVTLDGQISGRFDWSQGVLSGHLTINTNGVLNITGDSEKTLDSASAITNYGLIQWSGLGMVSGNDWNSYATHPAIVNLPGALFNIQNDSTLRLSPWVFNFGATVVFQNAGTLRKSAGLGTTSFENVSFQNSGTVDVQQGTLAFNGGSGAQLVSSGLFEVSSGAAVQLNGGSCSFLPGHNVTGQGFFGLGLGGFVTLDGQISGQFDWSQGVLSGHLTIATNGVLTISGDSEKTLDSGSAITNYGLIQWSGQGMISGNDWNIYAAHPAILNLAGALIDIQNDSSLRLSPWVYNYGATVVFQNSGTLRKSAGSGTTSFENVSLRNSGAVDVQRGTLAFGGGSGAQLVSSGLFQVTSGAAVQLNGGSCSFLPGHAASGQGFFGLGLGGFVTLDGQISGRFDWSQGVLSGHLTINTNGALNITGDSEKTLDSGSAITNYGLIQWSGQGMISGNDWNSYATHPAIVNLAGALFDIQNDSTLRLSPWVFNYGATVVFQNAGTLRKSAGPDTASFDGVQLLNTGSLELDAGNLEQGYSSQWINSGIVKLAISSPSLFSHLLINGTAIVSGQLEPDFLDGYLPTAGESFELLTHNGASIAFTNVALPSLPPGMYFSTLVDSTRLVLETRIDPIANPDSFSLFEDVPADLDVLANDSHLYGPGSIATFTQPSHGVVSLNPDNTLHYIPANNYFGNDSFTYQANNADGRSASASVSLTIAPVNDPPGLAALPDRTINEGVLLTFQASATDVENNQLTFSLSPGAPPGASIDSGTGIFSWTPTEAQGPGTYPIAVVVTDNGAPNESSSRTFLVSVLEVNSAPVLTAVADRTISELQPFTLQLSASDSDLPANAFTFNLVSGPTGLTVSQAGLLSWTPTEAQGPSTSLVTVAVADNGQPSLSATQSFHITVSDVNSAPVLTAQTNRTINELTLLTVTNNATDSDLPANTLSYTLLESPSGATIDTAGVITWTPTEAQGPSSNLFVTVVTDNGTPALSATNSFSVIVNEVNSAPTLTTINDQTIAELQPYTLQLSASDSDLPANTLSFSMLSGPVGLTVNSAGLLSWNPTEAQGPSTSQVTVMVSDDGQPSLSATQHFLIMVTEVNSAPILAAQTNRTINELTQLIITNAATDSDLPANDLTYSLLNAPSGATIDAAGVITWTPAEDQGSTTNLFTTVVTDNGSPALSATNSFSVVVNEVNTAPILNPINDQTISELQLFTLQLSASDSDLPANILTFSLVSGPAGLSVNSAGLVSWAPTEAQGPSTSLVIVAVADDGQPSLSATQSFHITVSEINSAPVLSAQTNRTISELTLLTITNNAVDSDLPANSLNYALLDAPSGAAIDAYGVITWIPSEAQGPSSNLFVTVVTDNGSPALSATNSFSVIVTEVNSAPTLSAISDQTISELQPFTLRLSASDSDLPANTLTFSLVSGPAGLTVDSTGLLSWTPAESQGPSANLIIVSVVDDGQPSLSATQSFQITVSEANSPPILSSQTNRIINELTLLTVTNTATDPDLPANTLSYALLNAPSGASISASGVITWTPSEAQGPSTNLIVTVVSDDGSTALSATNSFSVVVNEVNTAPVLSAVNNQTITELQPFTLQLSATDSDLPANTLTFSLVSGPAGLSVNSSGLLSWTPTEAQGSSTNIVSVAVTDNGQPSLSVTQSFQITVTEANSAPVLTTQTNRTINELTLLTVTNTATDPDLPANILSYALLSAPSGAAISPDGVITWTPSEAQGPSTNLIVTVVTDNGSPALSATNSFSVVVNEVNSAPNLTSVNNQTITELQVFTLQLAATDTDLPANTLTFSLVSGPAGLSVNSAGLMSWTPTEAQGPSTNIVSVAVTDNGQPSLSATQSFQITVIEANSAPVLTSQTNRTINELTLLTVTNTATDSDLPANILNYALINAPSGAAISAAGVITWTPSEAQGPSTNLILTVVTDNGSPALSATNSFSVVVNEVNTAPALAAVNNQTITELQPFTLQLAATDSDLPANTLTFSLVSGPAGLSVNSSGLLSWTPTEAQGPSTNTVSVSVADNGQPSLSVTQSFQITVTEANSAPILASQTNRTISELTLLTVTNTATDSDLPANILSYTLINAPSGAAISPAGIITWTPSEAQGPSTNLIVTVVTDNGSPALSATNSFSVVVSEVNTAPTLTAISDQTVNPAQTLNLTFNATDSDLPANSLTFSLDAAPAGASVSSGGSFSWTPGFGVAGTTNSVTARVTDNGTPSLSATRTFSIVVPNTGLKAEYFAGTNFDTLALTRSDPQVDFSWSSSPGSGVPADLFSVRWTGLIIPRYSQTYTLSTVTDDGLRLWVDGFLVIDNWTVHTNTTNTGTVALTAGQPYQIKLEYFDGTGSALVRLRWSSSSQALETVPTSQLLCIGYSPVVSNAMYRLTPKIATSKCMEASGGATADGTIAAINNWNNKTWQKWQTVGVSGGNYKLIPQHALTKVLEINGGFATNGTKVQISTDTGSARQQFNFVDMGQGWFKLQPQSSSTNIIQVKGGNTANNTPVELYQDNATDPQRWRLDRQ